MIVIIAILFISFLISMALLPHFIRGLRERGITVRDYYKKTETWVPTHGGILLLFIAVLSVTLYPLLLWFARAAIRSWPFLEWLEREPDLLPVNQLSALVIIAFGVYGLLDDYVDVGKVAKVIVPFLFTAPLVTFAGYSFIVNVPFFGMDPRETQLLFPVVGAIRADLFYRFLIVPLYIIVVANLINMHSGFNGLATGTSSIVISFLVAKSILIGSSGQIVTVGAVLGALLALWSYNFYPARIFEGNVGALMIGASLGCLIVIHGFIFSAFVMLIPHTIDFLMFLYLRLSKKEFVKFGRLRKDGTIEAPNPIKMKFLLPYYYRLTEKQTVVLLYGVTIAFCIIGILLPY